MEKVAGKQERVNGQEEGRSRRIVDFVLPDRRSPALAGNDTGALRELLPHDRRRELGAPLAEQIHVRRRAMRRQR